VGIVSEVTGLLSDLGLWGRREEARASNLGEAPGAGERRARALSLVEDLEGQFRRGVVKIGLSPDIALHLALFGPGAVLLKYTLDSTDRAIVGNFERVWPELARWRDVWLKWAEAGHRDDGSPYTWEQWESFHKDLGEEIELLTGEAWTSSNLVSGGAGLAQSASDAVTPSRWPAGLKAGLVVVGGLVVLNVGANVVRAARGD
jgi:hypothetical protein